MNSGANEPLESVVPLAGRWAFAEATPRAAGSTDEIEPGDLDWRPIQGPRTVASVLRELGRGSADGPPLDSREFWYRCDFEVEAGRGRDLYTLELQGLATHVDVWLNGVALHSGHNMFRPVAIAVESSLRERNVLVFRFRSLANEPVPGNSRPRWRTQLVDDQRLRHHRTTLLGRIPGWSRRDPPVGPWRSIAVRRSRDVAIVAGGVRAEVGHASGAGRIEVRFELRGPAVSEVVAASISVRGEEHAVAVANGADGRVVVCGGVDVHEAELWWPHGSGPATRHPWQLHLRLDGPEGARKVVAARGKVGFRTIEADGGGGGAGFRLLVNGQPLFCRGACWTPFDTGGGEVAPEAYTGVLEELRSAGFNMVRVGGTMVYEQDAFYEACDELGILVWQDFMFANLDYPQSDPAFVAEVRAEATEFLGRTQGRACLAVLCGSSEVAQEAAFRGVPEEQWLGDLFSRDIAEACAVLRPDLPYVPTTPWGGDRPFRSDVGISHYFGVGAYLRPLAEARLAGPCFAAECLAFSQLPDERSLAEMGLGRSWHDTFRCGVPRDSGAGWDFADVTEHYLERLAGVDGRDLRARDPSRYADLMRLVPGVLASAAYGEWRRSGSGCDGALVWFARDLEPGAGWGLVDSRGNPKAALPMLRRVLAPRALWFRDEGLNGLEARLANDAEEALSGELQLRAFSPEGACVAGADIRTVAEGRQQVGVRVEEAFGRFLDVTYAYRFGEPQVEVVWGRFLADDGSTIDAHFLVRQLDPAVDDRLELGVRVLETEGNTLLVAVAASRLARFVHVELPGYRASEDRFHLAPGQESLVRLRPTAAKRGRMGWVGSLNAPRRVAFSRP